MLYIMMFFSIIAGIDRIIGNKFKIGNKFDEGLKAIGELVLSIIGIYALSPIIGEKLVYFLGPLSKFLRVDPSVFLSSILAVDLGGYNTSIEVAISPAMGKLNGLILSSILGATISFTIPIAMGILSKEDFSYFAKGILAGITTIPIGILVGGLMMGIDLIDIIINLIPIIIFSILIILGLIKSPNKTIKIFSLIGRIIMIISTIGLILSIVSFTVGYEIIPKMIPFEEGIKLAATIGIVLSGAYPMFHIISKILNKSLKKIEKKFGLDQYSILGITTSLANCVPMLGIYEKMDPKGKVLNGAFIVSGAFTFGGQLGYISSVSSDSVTPFIIAKLVGGFSAILVASLILKFEKSVGQVY